LALARVPAHKHRETLSKIFWTKKDFYSRNPLSNTIVYFIKLNFMLPFKANVSNINILIKLQSSEFI